MNGKVGLLEAIYGKVMDVAQRVGPFFGFCCGLCYFCIYAYSWWTKPPLPAGANYDQQREYSDSQRSDVAQMGFGLGFGFLAAGLGRGQKKQSDLIVASEAEKRIDSSALSSTSKIPEIQKEIQAQKAGTSEVTNSKPEQE